MSLFDKNLYTIAEVANAAQGSVENSLQIIEAAVTTGANAIKFQLYKYDELATPLYEKYETFKNTFYTLEERNQFIEKACDFGADVWVDVFDRWGLNVARENRDKIVAVKIPPTVILNDELVKQILNLRLPTAIGIGGYEDEDIDFVLSKLKGYNNDILLMYGFQGFPTPVEDTSLRRIRYLKRKYGYPIGFADHISADSDLALRIPEYAFFAGATFIEKHITLDRSAKGLDYYSALEPLEFKEMVNNLKRCEQIFGTGKITVTQKDYLVHATRITTIKPTKSEEVIFQKDIKFRRTNNSSALYPNEVGNYFPAIALQDLDADAGITKSDIRKATAGIIVVCRLNSKRLPRKALVELNGVPAIERCLINTLASKRSVMTILATSTHQEDEELKNHTLNGRIKFFRGSENDPAARMLEAAELNGIDFIVRVTGDSPLISYELIDYLLESHIRAGADFSYFKDTPLGIKPEIINRQTINRLKSMIDTDGYSEYLTLYFKNNPELFQLNEVTPPDEYRFPQYRLNLDYPEDYRVLKMIFEGLNVGREPLSFSRVRNFLENNPDVANINASIKPRYLDSDFELLLNKITKIKEV